MALLGERELFTHLGELFNRNAHEEMRGLIDGALGLDGRNGAAHFWRGRLAEAENDMPSAIAHFENAIHFDPDNPLYHAFLAKTLDWVEAGEKMTNPEARNPSRTQRIEACWRRALDLGGSLPFYRCQYADYLVSQKRFREALGLLEPMHQAQPANDDVRQLWVKAHLRLGSQRATQSPPQPEEALADLEIVLEHQPDHPEANLFAGICCKHLGRLDEALSHLERSLPLPHAETAPFLFMPFFELATLHLEQGRLDAAREIVQRGLATDPGSFALKELAKRLETGESMPTGSPVPGSASSSPAAPAPPGPDGTTFPWAAPNLLADGPEPTDLLLKALPPEGRASFQELASALEAGQTTKAALLAGKLQELGPDRFLVTHPQRAAGGKLLVRFLRQARDGRDWPGAFPELFRLTAVFLATHADFPEFATLTGEMLSLPGLLFGRPSPGCELPPVTEPGALICLQSLRDLLGSRAFRRWLPVESHRPHLLFALSQWQIQLGDLIGQRREDLFLGLLGAVLASLQAFPELAPAARSLGIILPLARKALAGHLFTQADPIGRSLEQSRAGASPEVQSLLAGWQEAWRQGKLPELAPVPLDAECPELTVEFVYRSALEEILGDGTITSGEQEILQHLRHFLEISAADYERIFREVTEARHRNEVAPLDRDFHPEEFLFKVLTKMMEDGEISDREREIIRQVSNALLVTQDTLNRVFIRVREGGGNRDLSAAERRERKRLHDLSLDLEREQRLRSLFFSEPGRRTLDRLKPFFQRAAKADSLLPHTVTGFFYEPEAYPLPVIAVFQESPDVSALLPFWRGRQIEARFATDPLAQAGPRRTVADGSSLILWNSSLERPIPLGTILLDDSVRRFHEGLEASQGRHVIVLAHASLGLPLAMTGRRGPIDLTGQLQAALDLESAGRLAEAEGRLSDLQERQRALPEIRSRRGFCRLRLAQQQENAVSHLGAAQQLFTEEIAVHPASAGARLGMALLCVFRRQREEALPWLRQAAELNPVSVPVLVNLAWALWQGHKAAGGGFETAPAEIWQHLAAAWHLNPDHPLLVQVMTNLATTFPGDLPAALRGFPPDTRWQ